MSRRIVLELNDDELTDLLEVLGSTGPGQEWETRIIARVHEQSWAAGAIAE